MILQLDSEIKQKPPNSQKNCLHSSDFHHTWAIWQKTHYLFKG